jgi:membrane fusion protein, heavy metal efflux system
VGTTPFVRRAAALTDALARALPRLKPACPALALTCLLGGLAAMPATAAGPAAPAGPRAFGCLIEPFRTADVGSQVVGLVDHVKVERGDAVVAGQPLLTLRSDVERANAGVARTRASVDADMLAAQTNVELAKKKLVRTESLLAQNFVSAQAVETSRGEFDLAVQKLNQTKGQQRVLREEGRAADALVALRTVNSPFDGVVVERFVNSGERVEERPLMRIAVIEKLRVELMVPTAMWGTISELPRAEPVSATVRYVDKVLDAASNSFRVRLILPNPDLKLPAGLRCKADLPGGTGNAAAAEASASARPVLGKRASL